MGTYPRFAWSLRPEHFFRADDWDWLLNSALLPLGAYVHLWPQHIYNDRGAGALLITAVYRLVGLDNVTFHGIWVAIHLLNTLLVFALGVRLFRSLPLAWVAAYAFGNWTASTEAVTWVAAVFDLLAGTFVLASFLAFLSERAPVRVLSLVFYFLAMRTKESTLLLPVLLLIHFLWNVPRDRWRPQIFRRLGWHFGLMGLFLATYGYFYATEPTGTIQPSHPYFLRFDLVTLAKGLSYYLRAMLYRVYPLPVPLLAAGGALLIAGMVGRKGKVVVLGAAGFLLLLLPVVFLPNHRYALYLYAPSAFFAILWTGLAQRAMELIRWPALRAPLAAALALGLFLALPHRAAARQFSETVLRQTALYKEQFAQFRQRFPTLKPGAAFVLVGFPDSFSLFAIGPCHSLMAAYRDRSISCVFAESTDSVPKQDKIYVVLRAGRLEFF